MSGPPGERKKDPTTKRLVLLCGSCPEPACQARLFFPAGVNAGVECTECGQRNDASALLRVEEVTSSADAVDSHAVLLHNLLRHALLGVTASASPGASAAAASTAAGVKKGVGVGNAEQCVKVGGLSNYHCKLLAPILTRYGMDKRTGRAKLLSEMNRETGGAGDTFDCALLADRAFLISTEHLSTPGYGLDRSGSLAYLRDTLEEIRAANHGKDRLVPLFVQGDGHCLVHAISRALVGRELFWHALRENLKRHFVEFLPRYRALFSDFIAANEWEDIINECDPEFTPPEGVPLGLRNVHVFGLANVLRRPILLLDSLSGMRSSGDYSATFLPGLVAPENCRSRGATDKSRSGGGGGGPGLLNKPICLAWSSSAHNHYLPLVGVKEEGPDQAPPPRLPAHLIPKAWGVPQELIGQYLDLDLAGGGAKGGGRGEGGGGGGCVIGGERSLGDAYLRRLATAMDEVFEEKHGIPASLVADVHHYIFLRGPNGGGTGAARRSGSSAVVGGVLTPPPTPLTPTPPNPTLDEVTSSSRRWLEEGRLYRCLNCAGVAKLGVAKLGVSSKLHGGPSTDMEESNNANLKPDGPSSPRHQQRQPATGLSSSSSLSAMTTSPSKSTSKPNLSDCRSASYDSDAKMDYGARRMWAESQPSPAQTSKDMESTIRTSGSRDFDQISTESQPTLTPPFSTESSMLKSSTSGSGGASSFLSQMSAESQPAFLASCPACHSGALRPITAPGGEVAYRDGDRTATASSGGRCGCGFKHFWAGKEYDNLPELLPVNLEWAGRTVRETVCWFQHESDPSLNSNAYEVAGRLVDTHFPGEFGSELLVQKVVSSILQQTAVADVSHGPLLSSFCNSAQSGGPGSAGGERGGANTSPNQSQQQQQQQDPPSKIILIGPKSRTLHKEELTMSKAEMQVRQSIREHAPHAQRQAHQSPPRGGAKTGSGAKGAPPTTPIKEATPTRAPPAPSAEKKSRVTTTTTASSQATPTSAQTTPTKAPIGQKKIRVTTSDGRQATLTLPERTNQAQLKAAVAEHFGVEPERQRIRVGFPPKLLPQEAGPDAPVPLQHGERVSVEVLPAEEEMNGGGGEDEGMRRGGRREGERDGDGGGEEEEGFSLQDNIDLEMSSLCLLATLMGEDVWSYAKKLPHLFQPGGVFYNIVRKDMGLLDGKHCSLPQLPGRVFVYSARDDRLELCADTAGHFPISPCVDELAKGRGSREGSPSHHHTPTRLGSGSLGGGVKKKRPANPGGGGGEEAGPGVFQGKGHWLGSGKGASPSAKATAPPPITRQHSSGVDLSGSAKATPPSLGSLGDLSATTSHIHRRSELVRLAPGVVTATSSSSSSSSSTSSTVPPSSSSFDRSTGVGFDGSAGGRSGYVDLDPIAVATQRQRLQEMVSAIQASMDKHSATAQAMRTTNTTHSAATTTAATTTTTTTNLRSPSDDDEEEDEDEEIDEPMDES
ncbi:deubiquitinating protein VCPIP1 [Engraulis encrasicolus]|uniref:deubiquitinating protein VCPIP1 n=1 Tax=Engraulis encrasicolus TaxID=184585 RepID=UPI002FD0BDB3